MRARGMMVPQWQAVLDLQRDGLAAESRRLHRASEPTEVIGVVLEVMGDARLDASTEDGLQRLYRATCEQLPSRAS